MEQFQINLTSTKRSPEAVMFIGDLRCRVTLSPKTEQAIKAQKSLPAKSYKTRLNGDEAVLYGLRRSHAIPSDYPPDPESTASREAANASSKESVQRGSVCCKTSRTGVTPDQKDPGPPFLGVNFSKPQADPAPAVLPPTNSSTESRKEIRGKSLEGRKVATVRIGEEIEGDANERHSMEKKIVEWANYQQEVNMGRKTVAQKTTSKQSYNKAEIMAEFPPLSLDPPQVRPKRQLSPEFFPDILRQVSATPTMPTMEDSFNLLHTSTHPNLGFIHEHNHFPIRMSIPKQLARMKGGHSGGRNGYTVRETVGNGPVSFPAGDPPFRVSLLDQLSENPRFKNETLPDLQPKDLPRHRLAVDFNLYRRVVKHKARLIAKLTRAVS